VTPYPRLGLPVPLELVNTRFASGGKPVDALATPEDLDAWLRANADLFDTDLRAASALRAALTLLEALPARETLALLERFRLLREALHDVLGAAVDSRRPPPDAVRLLNELAAAAPRYPRLDAVDGAYRVQMIEGADADAAVLASVARAAMDLLTGPDLTRLRRCAGPGCVLLFLRERRRREWCSDACGNRARVARHYARVSRG
jgi:predicted RNA-binding Zn ribbon-like protein